MRRPEREAARWLAQADDDLKCARWLLEEERFLDKGCFLAQQAAEKALKSCLYRRGARSVLGHSVVELLGRLRAASHLQALLDDAKRLDRLYIPARYPNGLPGGSPFEVFMRADLEQALGSAERVVKAAQDDAGRRAVRPRARSRGNP